MKQQALFGLRLLELQDLITLYQEAKDETSIEQIGVRLDRSDGLSHTESATLSQFMSNLPGRGQVREIRIQFDVQTNQTN